MLDAAYADPVQLLRSVTLGEVTQNEHDIRRDVIKSMLGQEIRGIWSETVVPTFKEFGSWLREKVKQADIPRILRESASDVALAALSTIQPELAVAMKGVKYLADKAKTQSRSDLRNQVLNS